MVYRCARCGKPHPRDDPPCTDCGHDSFEEYDDTTSGTVDTGGNLVWQCQDCGREHVKHSPPCSRCGSQDLRKVEPDYTELDRTLEQRTEWGAIARPYLPLMGVIAAAGLVLIILIVL
ncbi:hypothetical protein [Natranaeroarchaeum sulfidigenes]|nr:hypothetical protein [Natranaeroarchaeum sulfidigenes]